jgi:hypothetical protein
MFLITLSQDAASKGAIRRKNKSGGGISITRLWSCLSGLGPRFPVSRIKVVLSLITWSTFSVYLFVEWERDDPFSLHIILDTGVRIVALVKRWHQQCAVVQLVQGLCAMLVDWCGQTRYNLMLNILEYYFSSFFLLIDMMLSFYLNCLKNLLLCCFMF